MITKITRKRGRGRENLHRCLMPYHEVSFDAQHHLFKLLDKSFRVVDAFEIEILLALQRGAQNLAERAAERRVVEELDRQTRVRGGDLVLRVGE